VSGGNGDDDSPEAKSKSGSVGSAGCSLIPTTRSASAVWLELGVAMLAGALIRRRRREQR
jgi:hypothetical protein